MEESGCREALCDSVLRDPSLFARLQIISSLYNRREDRYEHPLSRSYDQADVDRVLRTLHREIFLAWLGLSIRQQKGDLAIYVRGRVNPVHVIQELGVGENLVPPNELSPERNLFLQDIAIVRALLFSDLA